MEKRFYTVRRQLRWSHVRTLAYIGDPRKREFSAEMCRIERWSFRTLTARIDTMLYEWTALSRKPEDVIAAALATPRDDDRMTPELIFKDPYGLDFLGLTDRYLEKNLEDAIPRELEGFILEMGAGHRPTRTAGCLLRHRWYGTVGDQLFQGLGRS